MIAVAAHTHPGVLETLTSVLTSIGWTVHPTADADDALEACRRLEADIVLVGGEVNGGPLGLLDRLKRDAELFRTAVVVVAGDAAPQDVVDWLSRGADDVLLTPLEPADVVGRASAAARTKALVKELTLQNERLEELVFFDELTGLRNRRAILHELEMVLAGARRHGHQLSVLMLDIDRFKVVNDRHGHRAGDEVLKEVARRLTERLRREDVAGRLGGDELLVVLPDTGEAGAAVVAEAIRQAVAARPVTTTGGPIGVTLSVGSAAWAGEDLNVLLERADGALYAAKHGGRDQAAAAA
jgi:two-component system cell cycle response regulator